MKNLAVLVLMLSAVSWARDMRALQDEADRNLPPNVKWYLEQREKKDWFLQDGPFGEQTRVPDSQGLRLVGKWGRGPANKVTGRDSLVFMSLGSEVAIFNAADGHNPRVIAEIQCRNMTGRLCLKDSLLFVGSQGSVEVWSIANPSQPRFVSYGPVVAPDIAVQDTLVYALSSESLVTFNATDPANWQRLGATRDSGYSLNVADGFAYLADRWGLYVIDCTDPANPHRASTLSGGVEAGASWTDGNYCYYTETYPNSAFVIADVTDPYHASEVGRLTGIASFDLFKLSYFVYLPNYAIIDVSTPSMPAIVGSTTPGGNGVWTRSPFSYSFVALTNEGLGAVNMSDPVHPVVDTTLAGAHESYDVFADGYWIYIASNYAGMKILNTAIPETPIQVGSYDTTGDAPRAVAVTAKDSFAYLATRFPRTVFRVIDVSSRYDPRLAAYRPTGTGRACVVRETLAYLAEDGQLEIFSVANPRAPRLTGSCGLADNAGELFVEDSLAYVTNMGGVQVVNVANPASPVLVNSVNELLHAFGICIVDTIGYLSTSTGWLWTCSFADPVHPVRIGSAPIHGFGYDVAVVNHYAFVGCSQMDVIDVANPVAPNPVGYYVTPSSVRKVCRAGSYIYAACFGAGVCIFDTAITAGLAEIRPPSPKAELLTVAPNPATSFVRIRGEAVKGTETRIEFYDAAGRISLEIPVHPVQGSQLIVQQVDISALPDGCYFVNVGPSVEGEAQKVIKTTRR